MIFQPFDCKFDKTSRDESRSFGSSGSVRKGHRLTDKNRCAACVELGWLPFAFGFRDLRAPISLAQKGQEQGGTKGKKT